MKVYCKAPFNSLTIREDGIVRTCCPGNTDLGDLNVQSMSEIVNGTPLTTIRAEILEGTIPTNCRYCEEIERQGFNSMRDTYNITEYPLDDLKFLDLRWNTVCNLTCIYCDEFWSSSWAKKKNCDSVESKKKNYNTDLLEWIIDNSTQLSKLMLVGGEPLLMKQNFELLNLIKDPELKISIITNLSSNIEKNPISKILLNKFKNCDWAISIENIEDKFEYVRHGAKWTMLESNLRYLKNNTDNVTLLMVYGLFSAFNLSETVKYFYYNHNIRLFALQIIGKHELLDIMNYNKTVIKEAYLELLKIKHWIDELPPNTVVINAFDLFLSTLGKKLSSVDNHSINKSKFIEEISKYDNETKFSEIWNKEYNFILDSLK